MKNSNTLYLIKYKCSSSTEYHVLDHKISYVKVCVVAAVSHGSMLLFGELQKLQFCVCSQPHSECQSLCDCGSETTSSSDRLLLKFLNRNEGMELTRGRDCKCQSFGISLSS